MPAAKKSGAKSSGVRVRMYRQGLGDCFLLTFPGNKDEFHMLIDCGVLLGTKNADEIMKGIVEDIKKETKGRLNLVVVTHEHWDHISGFVQAQEVFDEISIDEVWAAWTEDPNNKLAKDLRSLRAERLEALRSALNKMQSPKFTEFKRAIAELFDFFGEPFAADKKKTTKAAWDYILNKKDARIKYCYPGRSPLKLSGVEGARIYILGPPEDPAFLNKSNPAKSGKEAYEEFFGVSLEETFFAAVEARSSAGRYGEIEALCRPFDSQYRILPDAAKSNQFFAQRYGFDDDGDKWRRIDDDWLAVAGEIALNLDGDTNNTCLVLAIELIDSGKVLLFPGDAQIGNWLSWETHSWKVKDENGQTQTVTSKDLLNRTVFYKVGHHGSHNATLRQKGLEMMESPDLVAMIPVNQDMAKKKKWNMPFPPLFERLKEKAHGRVLRADADDLSKIEKEAVNLLTKAEWNRFIKATKITEMYVEHVVSE